MVNSREQIFSSPMCSRGIGKERSEAVLRPHIWLLCTAGEPDSGLSSLCGTHPPLSFLQSVKKFPCHLCERSFCSAPSLRRHVRVNHEGIKRVYPCRYPRHLLGWAETGGAGSKGVSGFPVRLLWGG